MWKLLLLAAAACLHFVYASSPVIVVKKTCTDANATDGCGINCGKHCSNIFNPPANKSAPVICHALCRQGGCDCKPGYYADDNQGGKCVLPEDCVKPSCPKNAAYELCPTNCPPRTCATRNIQVKCIAPPKYPDDRCLPPGCRCQAGFYKNSNGSCVTKKECEMDCPENEVYDSCPAACPPRECKYKNVFISCIAQPKPGDPNCKPGKCRCKDGFLRNDEGRCVARDDCQMDCPENEVYDSCPSDCPPRECKYKDQSFSCPAQPVPGDPKCKPGKCRCKNGFLRNDEGRCVASKDCPINCPENEVYDPCPSDCPPRECKYKDAVFECPLQPVPGDPKCKPGKCRCENGFLRNDEGRCVAKDDCPATSRKRRDTSTDTEDTCGSNNQESSDSTDSSASSSSDSSNSNDSSSTDSSDTNTSNTDDSSNSNDSTNGSSNTDSNGSGSSTDTQQALQKFYAGNAVFTGKFFSQVSKDNAGKGTIMSPYSLLFLLAELALYAEGESYNELINSMGLTSKDEIRAVFPVLLDNIANVKNVTFNLASKTYSNKNFPLSDGFKKDTRVSFRAEAQELDMSKPAEAASIVNAWVANKTNDKIQNILSKDAISTDTRIILANALYFKGKWLEQFNKNLTTDQDFTTEDNQVKKVPTMYREAKYRYGSSQELDCEALEMKYENQDFSLIIYLPSKVGGLAALQEKMKDSQVVQKFRNSLTSQTVRIYIPKFKIETTIDLVPLLKSIGITKIFQSGSSGLTGLLAKPEDIFVSSGVQKAFVEVNEEGAEAAAANVIGFRATASVSKPQPLVFRANHGFVYAITNGNATVFLGTYAGK